MKHELEPNRALSRGSANMIGVAFGAVAVGALAIGALAIGRLAIRKMLIGGAKFKFLHVGELTVSRFRVSDVVVSESLTLPPPTSRENRELE
jgi:hypothetical protein